MNAILINIFFIHEFENALPEQELFDLLIKAGAAVNTKTITDYLNQEKK